MVHDMVSVYVGMFRGGRKSGCVCCTCLFACTYICMYACMYVYICAYMCLHVLCIVCVTVCTCVYLQYIRTVCIE